MIERGLFPVGCTVACLALLALLAFVYIVFFVAGETGVRRVPECLVRVAAVAFHVAVPAHKREPRLAMVEPVFLPVAFAVTVAARVAQRSFVLVILLVTGDAVHGRVLEERALVAGFALDVVVLAA